MGLGAKSEKDWDFDGLGGSLGAKSKKDWDFDFWFFFFFFFLGKWVLGSNV